MFKKLSLIMLLFLTVAIVPPTSTAQVFTLDGSENNRESTNSELSGGGSWGEGDLTPTDPYVGLGSGLMVLTLAGTAYACARRKKAKNHSERTGASKLS